MSQTIDQVFRDFSTDGVPASGEHWPEKPEIRALLKMIQNSGGQAVTRNTVTALNAVTPPNENYMGVVLTGADAGYYSRLDGAWVKGRGFTDTAARLTNVAGTGNAPTASTVPGVDPAQAVMLFFTPRYRNTGAMTLSVNGDAAKPLLTFDGQPMETDFLKADATIPVYDNGIEYRLLWDHRWEALAAQTRTDRNDAIQARIDSEEAQSNSEAAQGLAEAARDLTLGYRDQAQSLKEDAIAAAEASGSVVFFDTKAAADAATASFPANQIIEIFNDEARDGARTRYRKEGSALVFKTVAGLDVDDKYLAPYAGSVPSSIRNALNAVATPETFGAVGDGLVDDSLAFSRARSAGVTLVIRKGKTYRISTTTVCGALNPLGGLISIDATKTLTFEGVLGDLATIIFTGAGVAKSNNNFYSVGWYSGASGDAKWDFCRRAFVTNRKIIIVIPQPVTTDPAAHLETDGTTTRYKLANTWYWDDPENNAVVFQFGGLYVTTNNLAYAMVFSPTNKTEDIFWQTELSIDGGNNGVIGVQIKAGARIQFPAGARLDRFKSRPYDIDSSLVGGAGAGTSLIKFGFVNVTDCGGAPRVVGTVNHAAYNCELGTIFNNGCKGLTGTASVTAGGITSISIDVNGPNGQPQNLKGFGFPGQEFHIYSPTSQGSGARATPVMTGTDVTDLVVTAPGANYVNGEKVYITSCYAVLEIEGSTRGIQFDAIEEDSQSSVSNLYEVSDAFLIVSATSAGVTRSGRFGRIVSISGRHPAIITRDLSGGASAAAAKHEFTLDEPIRIPNPMYDGGALCRFHWVDGASVGGLPSLNSQAVLATITADCPRMRFRGVLREKVIGNADYVTFDGQTIYYVNPLPDDQVISFPTVAFNGSGSLHEITLMSNNAHGFYKGILRDANTPIDIVKGTLVDVSLLALTGITGTDGRITVSVNSNRLYIENRSAGALRMKAIMSN